MLIRRYAQVARPGTIVSTVLDNGHVETVTFITDRTKRPGFTTIVQRSEDVRDAEAMQALAVAAAR